MKKNELNKNVILNADHAKKRQSKSWNIYSW